MLFYRGGSSNLPLYWRCLIPAARYVGLWRQLSNSADDGSYFEPYLLLILAIATPMRPAITACVYLLTLTYTGYFYIGASNGFLFHGVLYSVSVLFYWYGMQRLPRRCRLSFSFVESTLVMQLSAIALYNGLETMAIAYSQNFCSMSETQQIDVSLSLLCLATVLVLLLALPDRSSMMLIKAIVVIALVPLSLLIGQLVKFNCSFLHWALSYFYAAAQYRLMLWWLVSFVASVCVSSSFSLLKTSVTLPTSTRRKFFHVIILAVLWPGITYNPNLTRLAAGGTLFILTVAELLKMHSVFPFDQLDEFWRAFTDSKDSGIVTLSHIYLLLGCSMPIFLVSKPLPRDWHCISVYSGLLSVAIGDACAAVVGKSLGRNFWPGPNNRRTLEGSFGFVVSQIIFIILLQYCSSVDIFGYPAGINFQMLATFIFSVPVALVAVVEANCEQFDNVVLPAITFVFFKLLENAFNR